MNIWQQLNTILMIFVVVLTYTIPGFVFAFLFLLVAAPLPAIGLGILTEMALLVGWKFNAWMVWHNKETDDEEFDRLRDIYYNEHEICTETLEELRVKGKNEIHRRM